MRRNLFGTNCLEKSLHIVEVGEHDGVLVRVVRMHVSLLHVLKVALVVSLSVLSFIHCLGPI